MTARAERRQRIATERDPDILGRFAMEVRGAEQMEVIRLLGDTGSPAAEPYLLQIIEAGSDRYVVPAANAALGKVGTPAAIPQLVGLIHHPVEDIKTSVGGAAASVLQGYGTPVVRQHFPPMLSVLTPRG